LFLNLLADVLDVSFVNIIMHEMIFSKKKYEMITSIFFISTMLTGVIRVLVKKLKKIKFY